MKHIKLFEAFTSLPVDYTKDQIENMSEDEFFRALDKYRSTDNIEGGLTLVSIWLRKNSGPLGAEGKFYDREWVKNLTDAVDFMGSKLDSINQVRDIIDRENYDTGREKHRLTRIANAESDIKKYEKMIADLKVELEKLRSTSL